VLDRAAAATPPAPDDPKQRSADEDAQQHQPEPAKVTTPVDRATGQRLAIGLDDLLAARQRLGDNLLRPRPTCRRERCGPRTQRRKQQHQGQQDPDGRTRRDHPHAALTLPYPREIKPRSLRSSGPSEPARLVGHRVTSELVLAGCLPAWLVSPRMALVTVGG